MCKNMAAELMVGNRGTDLWRVGLGAGYKLRQPPCGRWGTRPTRLAALRILGL